MALDYFCYSITKKLVTDPDSNPAKSLSAIFFIWCVCILFEFILFLLETFSLGDGYAPGYGFLDEEIFNEVDTDDNNGDRDENDGGGDEELLE
ncbi:28S ribosomal protein S9 [Sarcoptes scabiei]|uniref:Uncharacterized protein n=1 Tax=Sarcoptes scabiei TaxID=52283 RepID=A0A834R738_SARSC|nr:28S ribosomal protein S9 [Sarcoptes scabiei]